MKEGIHPKYGKAIVRCVCGETFETGSTKKELKVDICSKCHPFFIVPALAVGEPGRMAPLGFFVIPAPGAGKRPGGREYIHKSLARTCA